MKQPHRNQMIQFACDSWAAGVKAADAKTLVRQAIDVSGSELRIGNLQFDLDVVERIRVVGAGKPVLAMVRGLEEALGLNICLEHQVSGWVNMPESSTGPKKRVPTGRPTIWPFPARPGGENLPTLDAFGGTLLIEDIVSRTASDEICIGLISGGGSALLVHPAGSIRIEDKRKLISWMSAQGATIQQLNTVRKHISDVKGGRLAARFQGMHMACLILSDVIQGPIDAVASGPTVQDSSSPQDALNVLRELSPSFREIPKRVISHLERMDPTASIQVPKNVTNIRIGDIETATQAAQDSLSRMGFECVTENQTDEFEQADAAGRRFAHWIFDRIQTQRPLALISGGEPVVQLSRNPGLGGRNQQLVLAALDELLKLKCEDKVFFALLSAGTDREDGNTEVAGAMLDDQLVRLVISRKLDPAPYLRRNDAYSFFCKQLPYGVVAGDVEGQTNVCDLRVILVAPKSDC